MSSNKIIKSVSFNMKNEEDVAMLKAIKRRNFSGYVKELIWADIEMKNSPEAKSESVTLSDEELSPQELAQKRIDEIKRAAQERAAKDKGG